MEINLILTAQTWQLAALIKSGPSHGGVLMVKNLSQHTYLCVTPKQWQVLLKFRQAHTVPSVLEKIIEERTCPALGEFYELILKAVRARILVGADPVAPAAPARNWWLTLRPARLAPFVWILFVVGFGLTVVLQPALPTSVPDALMGLGILALTSVLGAGLSASLLRGAGGEVYRHPRWFLSTVDACMLTPADQRTITMGPIALLTAATGFLAWQRPELSFIPLAGLMLWLRPVLRGPVNQLLRVSAEKRVSDAVHDFHFPPNRSARMRWKLLRTGLRNPTTWLEIFYATLWTIALGYFIGAVTEVPPWRLAFWETNGFRLGASFFGSLLLLGIVYLGSEFYLFARERAVARHETLRLFWRRWFRRGRLVTDENERQRAILRSPLLRQLPPAEQQTLKQAMQPVQLGPWATLHPFDTAVDQVSFILSGQVGVYRRNHTGRRELVQVLCENDLVGLHALADPLLPNFMFRTLTPVLLLRVDWAVAGEMISRKFTPGQLANLVQKGPFLSRISLCQNWHLQAIQRFAELTRITTYAEDDVILQQGSYSDNFFIVFEGQARVMIKDRQVGTISAANFFGEIGLLQNNTATAQVIAGPGARCLCISRREFLRFMTHNHTVGLKLERVSSQRLGYPIFPLSTGNFRTT